MKKKILKKYLKKNIKVKKHIGTRILKFYVIIYLYIENAYLTMLLAPFSTTLAPPQPRKKKSKKKN